jgi:uncharacterized membrane protein YvbJ
MAHHDTVSCPHCGEEIQRDARACPHCGSDENTGWSSDTYLDGIDLPDDAAYEDIRANEFDEPAKKRSHRTWIVATAIIVLAAFIAGIVSLLR